jgi:hypothetical protein
MLEDSNNRKLLIPSYISKYDYISEENINELL